MAKIGADSSFQIKQLWPIYEFLYLVMSIILNEYGPIIYFKMGNTLKLFLLFHSDLLVAVRRIFNFLYSFFLLAKIYLISVI
jgi:hypothetical protein